MKTLKTTKKEIEVLLNEKIDNLFLILQNENNIHSGDIYPLHRNDEPSAAVYEFKSIE
jgi:hypothetical protein